MTKRKFMDFRGKMASTARIDERIEHIAHFDKQFQRAIVSQDLQGLKKLADWADEIGLTISHRAKEAARELEQACKTKSSSMDV